MTYAAEMDASALQTGAMIRFGGQPLARSPTAPGVAWQSVGQGRSAPATARHVILGDGGVRIHLPVSGVITDAEARRLAWAILSDLSPDEVIGAAEVVTYAEGQRQAVIRAIGRAPVTAKRLAAALGWPLRVTQRRLRELVCDERVIKRSRHKSDPDTTYSIAVVV